MNVRRIASIGLAAVLQVLPLTRVFVAATPAVGSSYAIIATWIAGAAALMGGIDAVSGASTTITSAKTATATNGVAFSYRITTGPDVANTFAATPLPAGLVVGTSNGRITGTPTVTGVYVIHLTASDSGKASRTVTADLTLTILAGSGGGGTAPSITAQPTSQTVVQGGNTSFTVTASGTAPLSYQWRLGGATVASATNSTLNLSGVTTGQAGSYTCVVTNSAGSVTSSVATLTVLVPPSITTQPTSQTVTAGGSTSFSIAASGTAPLSYQWKLNGANVSGATGATLNLTGITISQAGSYTCVVSNAAGFATSGGATLTVNPAIIAPAITGQPIAQTVTEGGSTSFTVTASGTAPLSYQWRWNGANLAGATSATLNLTGISTNQAGSYACVVTNAAGSVTSSVAILTVNPIIIAPTITKHPLSQAITEGSGVSFTVAASGTAPFNYQWRWNGVNISGATNALLSLTSVTINQAGSYACMVTNSAGSAISSAAILTVNPLIIAPTITAQPGDQSVTVGANVSFSVVASGTAPLGYQWRSNGTNISGATSASLAVNAVTLAQSGFTYSCVVSNAAGSATSSTATLTVTAAAVAPTITAAPANQAVTAGANVSFSVGVNGTAPLSYQWLYNGANLPGATSPTLTLAGVTTNQAGSYSVFVTNIAGNATSGAATLTVNPAPIAPSFTLQPVSQSVTAGTNVTFTVAASGTAPLSYQWRWNGVDLSGATSATLSLSSVVTNQSGGYSCVVSNVAGTATSSTATLTVNPLPVAPTITTQPGSQTVTAGTNVTFMVVATGTVPMSYQWRLNGVNISGATSATLNLSGVTTNLSGGSYSCFVSNVAGATVSSAATLTVNPAPVAPGFTLQPVSQTVTAGTNVTFTVAVSGTMPLSYQWRLNGANISGATSAVLTLTGVATNQSGAYSCFVSNLAGTATSSAATLTVNPLPVPPTITLQPVSQTVTAGANVTFSVAASGTAPLGYQWRWNGVNISGATSPTLTLSGVATNQAGSYLCVVSNAVGSATSAAATLTVNAATLPGKLTILITGQGQVLPNLNGVNLTIGKVYTLSVYPAAGYVFSGWERDAQPLSTSTLISFVMTSNLVLTANFVPDTTVYNGLFYETAEVRLDSTGAFNIGLTTSGSFTAWVQIGYSRYQFSGQLDANFQATCTVPRWNGTPLTVQITIGQDALAGQIYGSVSDGVWTAPLSGGRSAANSPHAGEYTVVLPGTSGNASLPAGDGYATLHVAADGLGTMSTTLADGTRFSQSAYVTRDGDWPLYVSLYVGKGALVSWLTFTNLATSDVSGDLIWIKQAGASATSYPLGFTNGTKAVGSIYLAPDTAGKAVNLSSAVANFSGGSLPATFSNVVSVNAGSQVVNLSPNLMTFTVAPGNGLFSGQVNEPGTGVTHNFGGVILQKQNAGYGTVGSTPNGSRVVLAAP